MSEAEDVERVVNALKKVPPKRLLIIELATRIPIKNGEIDCDEMARIKPEVNLAIVEAKMYGSHTMMAVDTLKRMAARVEDV